MDKKKRKELLGNPAKREKHKASAIAAIILASISIFLAVGVLEFTSTVFGGVFQTFFAIFKGSLTIIIWLLAIAITMISLILFSFTLGNIPIFGYQLFSLGAEIGRDTNNTLFVLISLLLCVLLIVISLAAFINAMTQLKINRRKLSWVGLGFSILAIVVNIPIIIISLLSVF